jgi:hypothetical protein
MVDSDADGCPDGWVVSGAGRVVYRNSTAGSLWGRSQLAGVGVEFDDGAAYVSAFSVRYAVPAKADTDISGGLSFRVRCYPGESGKRFTVELRHLKGDGTLVKTDSGSSPSGTNDYTWSAGSVGLSITSSEVAVIEIRLSGYGDAASRLVLDSLCLRWMPWNNGSAVYTMDRTPIGASRSFLSDLSASRDAFGAAFQANPSGISSRSTLDLRYTRCAEDDFVAWQRFRSVNHGVSGYKDASGGNLRGAPLAVSAGLWEPTAASGTDALYHVGAPDYAMMNVAEMGLQPSEWPGWGYQGPVRLEEVS